jgi:hypothetical protein
MKKIGTTSSGTVIVEMTAAQFEALAQIQAPPTATTPAAHAAAVKMTPAERVSYVRERIIKLQPKKKDAVVRSITAMFQFTGGIADQEIQRIIGTLQKEKFFAIDGNERITYREGSPPHAADGSPPVR